LLVERRAVHLGHVRALLVRGRVPPYVAATQQRFTYCRACDRITWPATHWQNMERRLTELGLA